MAAGKRKRELQTYGRRNNHRANFLRAQETFFPNQERLDQSTLNAWSHTENTASVTPSPLGQTAEPSTRKAAAAMAVEPSEDDVNNVAMFTSCSGETAVRYLKVKKTVEAAVNAILDNEDISKEEANNSHWDESVWETDREGNVNAGDNNLRPLGGTSTAPTRVPSPSGNVGAPTNRDDEDAQLAQALAASQQGSGMSFQQESGVVHADGTSQQTYGPATKYQSAHDREWGMVLSSQASSEIIPDIERPEDRKNIENEPRFLKNLPSGDYLPNFLTIGHSIPAMRECLLLRDYTMAQYGTDADWWKGHQIALPKIVHTEDGAPADAEIDKWDAFISETQRLMAALDASQRSYASVNALTQTEVMRSGGQYSDLVTTFLQRFIAASDARTDRMDEMRSFFSTEIGSTKGMMEPFAETLALPIRTVGDETKGLMEILDGLLWDTDSRDYVDRDNFIIKGADVLVLLARQEDSKAEKLQLKAPSTLYIDKYLEKNVDVCKPYRLEIAEQKRRVAKLNEVTNKLTKWQHPERKDVQLDAKDMLRHTLGHFSGKNMADATKADSENGIVLNGTSTHEQPHYADIAARLEAITLSVDKKIARLQEQKDEVQKNISKLSNSSPPQLEEQGLKERYTLMGVATKPSTTYVLRPKEDGDDDDHMSTSSRGDQTDVTPDGMQWWRIDYVTNGTQPRIEKVTVDGDTVLQAIEVEHTSALLVYASDLAVDDPNYDPLLPPVLQQFVEDDDFYFNLELHDANRTRPPPAYEYGTDADVPRQSIEPSGRRASIDSTCAEVGVGDSRRGSHDLSPYQYDEAPPNSGMPPAFNHASSSAQHVEDQVAEIHLPSLSPNGSNEAFGTANGVSPQEMVEAKHEPFLPAQLQQQQQQQRGDVDAKMADDSEAEGAN